MQFEVEHSFDRPMADVLRMFTDRSYFERKIPLTGSRDMSVQRCEKTGDRFEIRYSFKSSAEVQLPDIAKKFLSGGDVTVKQSDAWDAKSGKGRIDIDLGGLPVSVGCEMQVRPRGNGCVNTLKWTIKVSVPLIGGKLERVIADDLERKMKRDFEVSTQLLKDY